MALLWCAVIGLELFFLLNDITLFQATQSEHPETIGKPIAELHFSSSGVRWQNPRDVVWNESRPGQRMYEGQSVMTLSGSQARLIFDARGNSDANSASADVLEIGERSLVELRAPESVTAPDGPLSLSLLRGSVRSQIGREVFLSAGEFRIQLEPGAKFEAVQQGEVLRLNLESGRARAIPVGRSADKIADQKSEPILLAPGQGIDISTRPSETSETRSPPVVRPLETAPSPLPSAAPSPPAQAAPVLQIPPTRLPPTRLPPPKTRAPILRPRTPPPRIEGALFRIWNRLIPTAHAEASPAPTPEWEIELQWDGVPDAKAYRVEISRTRSFKNRVAETTVASPSWIWLYRKGMENSRGRVFYRVASVDADGTAGSFSEPRIIVIPKEILAESKPPPAVAAKTPVAVESPVRPVAVSSAPSSSAPTTSTPMPTRWSFRPSVEYRSYSQTSDYPLLRRTEPSSGFLHEGLRIERESERFFLALGLRGSHYEKTNPPVGETEAPLAKTRSLEGRISLFVPFSPRATGWRRAFFYGASGFLEDRFVKSGPNRLALRRGVSLGPAAGLRSPTSWVALSLPLTGPYGATIEAQKNWALTTVGATAKLHLSIGAEGSWHYWKAPPNSRVVEWALGIGPKVVFE